MEKKNMIARYVQRGDSIDYTPAADVAAGDIVVVGDIVGIAKLDIKAGTLGSLALIGVYDIVKAGGTGTAVIRGAKVYWNATAKTATIDSASGVNPYLGKAFVAAADADTVVRVRLD